MSPKTIKVESVEAVLKSLMTSQIEANRELDRLKLGVSPSRLGYCQGRAQTLHEAISLISEKCGVRMKEAGEI